MEKLIDPTTCPQCGSATWHKNESGVIYDCGYSIDEEKEHHQSSECVELAQAYQRGVHQGFLCRDAAWCKALKSFPLDTANAAEMLQLLIDEGPY